jgi:hypothetical protein
MAVFLVLAAQEVDDRAMVVSERDTLFGSDGIYGFLAEIGFQQVTVVIGFLLIRTPLIV